MVTFLAVTLGWLLVLLVVVDAFRTVLWSSQGAGPLTGTITGLGRRLLPRIPGDRARSAVGPLAIVAIVAVWSLLLLVGFTLVFEGDPDAIRTASTDRPVGWSQRAYFVGYSLFTLGNGDLAPVTDAGRLATVAISATGLFLITLSVTYVLPVISASVASRSFASGVQSLGDTPQDVVLGAWDGERVRLDHQLCDLATQLSLLAEQQLAYPVLHLFHSPEPSASAPLAVARVDDVLTLLDGLDGRVAPTKTSRRQLRAAVHAYVQTYGHPVGDSGTPPPLPDTQQLATGGIPLLDPVAYSRTAAELGAHRADVHHLARAATVHDR